MVAPVDGEIETQIVAVGDYVKVGDPLFRMVGVQELRVHLLLPEAAATRIKPGLKVLLSAPAAPEQVLESRIDEIKPTLGPPTARSTRSSRSAAWERCSAAAAR